MKVEHLLTRIDSVVKIGAKVAALGAGWILLATALLMATEVILRKTLNVSIQGVDEIGGYVLAITASLGFTYALYTKAHIPIDLIVRMLPPVGQRASQVVALMVLNFVVWSLIDGTMDVVQQSYAFSAVAATPLRTPLIVPQTLWILALLLFGLAAFLRLLLVLRALSQPGQQPPDEDLDDIPDLERPPQRGTAPIPDGGSDLVGGNVSRSAVP